MPDPGVLILHEGYPALSSSSAGTLLLAAACRGDPDTPLEVSWDADNSAVSVADEGPGAAPLQTVAYDTNNTDAVVRDGVLRLFEDAAESEIGLTLGTVKSVSANFKGNTRFSRLGDMEAGNRGGLRVAYGSPASRPTPLRTSCSSSSSRRAQPSLSIRGKLALTLKE